MQEIAPGIVLFDNVFLDAMSCIKDIEENSPRWEAAEVLLSASDNTSGTDYKARDTDLMRLPHYSKVGDKTTPLPTFVRKFHASIEPLLQQYMDKYGAKIVGFECPQLLRYGPGQKFHDHIDDHPLFTRRISLTFYINDEYEGGDVEFNRFNTKISAKANQLLVFPSNYVYNHMVHPVTSGVRYVVVQWAA